MIPHGLRPLSPAGTDIDNLAAAGLFHVGDNMFAHQKHAFESYIDSQIPIPLPANPV